MTCVHRANSHDRRPAMGHSRTSESDALMSAFGPATGILTEPKDWRGWGRQPCRSSGRSSEGGGDGPNSVRPAASYIVGAAEKKDGGSGPAQRAARVGHR